MDEAVNLLVGMLEIYSPSGREGKLASYLKDSMEELGYSRVRIDRVGNVYGEMGGGEPTVLLCGHMDTIRGWIPVRLEDGKLYGRGSVDAKSSLAAMIYAAATLNFERLEGRVLVSGVVDEEGRSRGIRQLLREGLEVDYAIFGEPSGLNSITFAYRGRLRFKVYCRTLPGHVGAIHIFSNAIEEAYNLWAGIKSLFDGLKSPHGVFYSPTPCLIGIRSREVTGVTPSLCVLDIDLRLPPTLRCGEAEELVRRVIEDFKGENVTLPVGFRVLDRVEPFVADRRTPLMRALAEAIKEVVGVPARFIRKTGTGDMNIFGSRVGVPVATYGPGNSRLSHTDDEYVKVDEYLTSIRVYRRTLEKLLSGSV